MTVVPDGGALPDFAGPSPTGQMRFTGKHLRRSPRPGCRGLRGAIGRTRRRRDRTAGPSPAQLDTESLAYWSAARAAGTCRSPPEVARRSRGQTSPAPQSRHPCGGLHRSSSATGTTESCTQRGLIAPWAPASDRWRYGRSGIGERSVFSQGWERGDPRICRAGSCGRRETGEPVCVSRSPTAPCWPFPCRPATGAKTEARW